MAGLFAISVDPELYKGDFLEDLFWGTFYQQHLGEDYAGLSTLNEGQIKIRTHRGLFRPTFSSDLQGLEGTEGIGYCGSAREPFLVDSKLGKFSVCFSGNIVNLPELIGLFKSFGHTLERGDDVEIIAKLLVQGCDFKNGIKKMTEDIKGAYSLLILTESGIYATCCPTGQWPLVIGEKEGAVVVSSGSGGFSNNGFKLVRDVEPGEIIFLENGRIETKEKMVSAEKKICSFIWVYTGFPNDTFHEVTSSLIRKRLGAALARRDIKNGFVPDVVVPVPDSGRFYAIGYHQEFCRQVNSGMTLILPCYDEVLLKYPYAGRSFTPQTQEARDQEAQIKLLESGEDYRGKRVVVCDDSIVRGTQMQTNLVPKLRMIGVKEVHFRIGNPELRSYCPWGKTIKKGETLVSRMPSIEERIRFLGVDGLEYNTTDDLIAAIGISRKMLCIDCSLDLLE